MNQRELRGLLDYDHRTGVFTRKVKTGQRTRAGKAAGGDCGHGYIRISVNSRLYYAHRLVWMWVYGKWPAEHLDHRNGIRHDNRLSNLRECSNAENMENMRKPNKRGFLGVGFARREQLWRARIMVRGKDIHLGYHKDQESARKAHLAGKKKHHTFFVQ